MKRNTAPFLVEFRRCLFLLTVGLPVFLTIGCRSIYRIEPVIDTTHPRTTIWTERNLHTRRGFRNWILDLRPSYINPYTYQPPGSTSSLYQLASVTNPDAKQAKMARNQLQNAILGISLDATGQHLAGLKSTENGANLVLGAATLGLTGGASVAAPLTAKALSASATGTGGARSLFNEQTFRNALVESLAQAVETDRDEFLETVIRPRQLLSIDKYDVEAAIFDARNYHERGSFYHGLALIREAVEKESSKRKTNVLSASTNLMNTLRNQ